MSDFLPPPTPAGMPHHREFEEAVIGSVLISPEVYEELAYFLADTDFYLHRLRFIWRSFGALTARHEPIDYLTVSAELERMGKLEEIGGGAYLTGLLNQVPTTLHAEQYGRVIVQDSTRRKLLTAANEIARAAYDESLTLDDALATSDKALLAAQGNPLDKRGTRSIKLGLSDLYDVLEERSKNPSKVWGMETGFPDWDNLTGGLHPGEMTIIGAPPGASKTILISQLAKYVSRTHGVAIYELEMSEQALLTRMVSAECGITTADLKRGFIGDKWELVTQAIQRLEKSSKLFINDTPGLTTAQLRADLARLVRQHDIKLLVVDYLNLLGDKEAREDHDNAAIKARRLRQIGKEFGLSVITIQSMTKDGMEEKTPSLNAMAGRSNIQFDADNIFFFRQRPDNKKIMDMIPAKQRESDGSKPVFSLLWDARLPKFNNLTRSEAK
jgi:replicative DNA helicase